jgi:hypothetical protein
MSNVCLQCQREIAHDDRLCSKNATCTAKGMEAIGSSRIVLRLFNSGDSFVLEYVGDDDSSPKKVLRHRYVDQLETGLIDDYPRYANGRKKTTMASYLLVTP